MKELRLPAPADQLWLETRDVLTTLGGTEQPWTVHLSGGTTLAARVGHRESTDIDVVVRERYSLGWLTLDNEDNLARTLGGRPLEEHPEQIKVELANGVIDVSTAPVEPEEGAEQVVIAGRSQGVLSTTQIIRGKLERAARPAPVRDVYDIIRLSADGRYEGEVVAAYGLLTEAEQTEIENTWVQLDGHYEEQAREQLKLTEKPCSDLALLGSRGAQLLNGHRLQRVVIELEGDRIRVERTTQRGHEFQSDDRARESGTLLRTIGTANILTLNQITAAELAAVIEKRLKAQQNGVVFDSADPTPRDRISGRNTSTKRHDTAAEVAVPKLPAPREAQGKKNDERAAGADYVVQGQGDPAGGVTGAAERTNATVDRSGPKGPGED